MKDYSGISPATLPDPKDDRFVPRVRSMLNDVDIYLRELSRGMARIQNGQVPDGSGDSIVGPTNPTLDDYFYLPGRVGALTGYFSSTSGATSYLYPSTTSDLRFGFGDNPVLTVERFNGTVTGGNHETLLKLKTSSTVTGNYLSCFNGSSEDIRITSDGDGTIVVGQAVSVPPINLYSLVAPFGTPTEAHITVKSRDNLSRGVEVWRGGTTVGAAGGEIIRWTANNGTTIFGYVDWYGSLFLNNDGSMATGRTPLTVRATDAATDMTQWKNSSGTVVSRIEDDGTFNGPIASTSSSTFSDSLFRINDNTTPTKQLAFECSGITAATTRTVTIPDASGTLAYINTAQTFTKAQTITPDVDVVPLTITQGSATGNLVEINVTGPVLVHAVDALGQAYYNGALVITDGNGAGSSAYTLLDGTTVSAARTWSFPDADGTFFVGSTTSQTITNKIISSGGVALTGQTGAIGTTNITISPSTTALYMVEVYAMCTTASGAGAPTLDVTIGWTDSVGATTQNVIAQGSTPFPLALSATGRAFGTVLVRRASGNITYATTINAAAGTPAYALYIRAVGIG